MPHPCSVIVFIVQYMSHALFRNPKPLLYSIAELMSDLMNCLCSQLGHCIGTMKTQNGMPNHGFKVQIIGFCHAVAQFIITNTLKIHQSPEPLKTLHVMPNFSQTFQMSVLIRKPDLRHIQTNKGAEQPAHLS